MWDKLSNEEKIAVQSYAQQQYGINPIAVKASKKKNSNKKEDSEQDEEESFIEKAIDPNSTVVDIGVATVFTVFKPTKLAKPFIKKFKVDDWLNDLIESNKGSGKTSKNDNKGSNLNKNEDKDKENKDTGIVNSDVIRKVENDILDKMESLGGHTLDRHVGKSNEELIKRAIQENVETATTFTDKSTAIKAVQENLRKNADDIAEWLNESDKGRKVFEVSHRYSIEKGVLEDKKQVIYNLTNSRVILIRDPSNELGFRILTAFPIIK